MSTYEWTALRRAGANAWLAAMCLALAFSDALDAAKGGEQP